MELAKRITAHPRMRQILDKGNQDYDGFALWLADMLRAEGVYQLPAGIVEALNSGDGVYRP
jgi:hypothetical protein